MSRLMARRYRFPAAPADACRAGLRILAFFAFVLPGFIHALPAHSAQLGMPAQGANAAASRIHIAQAGWGDTDLDDLQIVLDAVASELAPQFPNRTQGAIRVVPGSTNPAVLFQKGPGGEYLVELSARNGRWYLFAYQFSHELCHIYSNYDNKISVNGEVVSANQWFEESLCEAAALYTLKRLAATWETSPPSEKWIGYSKTFARFSERLLSEPHRQLPPNHSLAAWYREHQDELRANPYLRDKDEVVSNLLLGLFEQNPDDWGAIAYLNAEMSHAANGFEQYLDAWCQACPERYRRITEQIMALFGSSPSRTTLASGT